MTVGQLERTRCDTRPRRRRTVARLLSGAALVIPLAGLAFYVARHGAVAQLRMAASGADVTWALVSASCALLAFPAAAATIRVAANARLPWIRTTQVEFAGTLLNRIIPNGVGRAVLAGRYLVTRGLPSDRAAAAIAATVVAGFLVHTGGILITVSLGGASRLAFRPAMSLEVGVGVTVAVVGLAAGWIARRQGWLTARRRWLSRLRGQLLLLCLDPGRVIGVLAGVAAASCCTLLAFWSALNAITPVALLPAATVYLIGTAVSNVAPAPGGLGVTEASLTGALVMTGVPAGPALVGVLLFRLVSFWIPTLLGAVSWVVLWRATNLLRLPALSTSGRPRVNDSDRPV